jgi:hypothetical protein
MYKFQCCQCCHSIILTSTLIWASQENFAKQHLIGLQCATAQVKDSASDLLQCLLEYKKFFRHISELFQVRISDNDVAAYNFFQFQTDMQLPLGLTGDPGPSSWFQNAGADGQQTMMLPDDSSLLHQR